VINGGNPRAVEVTRSRLKELCAACYKPECRYLRGQIFHTRPSGRLTSANHIPAAKSKTTWKAGRAATSIA
jgi:hypothetical protein